ncbi:hypothetical protein PR048_017243 [Dryococelus australis]|uniref:Telomeric repeat-binding factor 2-interacting protein 1 n=1 Tax=Dryococelus australis TaxID=614101 RepID=A0ABQ9H8Z5_9NEOP|nr:hypothetical protein PR048_017243 [Dryococelus australis]
MLSVQDKKFSVNPTLFLNFRGDALVFYIKPCKERTRLRKIIESGNGFVVSSRGQHSVTFAADDETYDGDDEVFSVRYIDDCCKFGKQLDLKEYRVNKISRFGSGFDVMEVFVRNITWERAEKKWGSSDSSNSVLASASPNGKRFPYSMKEKRMIVDYVIEHESFSSLKGNVLWQEMSKDLANNGISRSWQSLKEHYRKQILPNIESFKLSRKLVRRFQDCV